jgi:hypothetical protein
MSCKLFMCLFYLSTEPLRNILFFLVDSEKHLLAKVNIFLQVCDAILTDVRYPLSFQRILYCVFVDLFQIQCLQRSHHRKLIVQQQKVFHPGKFYVHIFQLNDFHFQLHLYGLSLQYKFLDDLNILHFFP